GGSGGSRSRMGHGWGGGAGIGGASPDAAPWETALARARTPVALTLREPGLTREGENGRPGRTRVVTSHHSEGPPYGGAASDSDPHPDYPITYAKPSEQPNPTLTAALRGA